MTDSISIPWPFPPRTPEEKQRDREWLELAWRASVAVPPYRLIGARPLHPSPWQPIDEHTPRNRWILLRGGTTDESFYTTAPEDFGGTASERPVVAHWKPGTNLYGGEWVIGYWDGGWFNAYDNPKEWMEIPT